MAVFRNVMAFLGLDDDDQVYDDEAYYDEDADEPGRRSRAGRNQTIDVEKRLERGGSSPSFGFAIDNEAAEVGGVGAVRPLRPVPAPEPTPDVERRRIVGRPDDGLNDGSSLADRLTAVEATPPSMDDDLRRSDTIPSPSDVAPSRSPQEADSAVAIHAKPRLHLPSSFDEASRIADDFRAGSPVVINLSGLDKSVARRLVDFSSGVCYVLGGGMERLAGGVYLLTPHGVDVSTEDRRRMHERGFNR